MEPVSPVGLFILAALSVAPFHSYMSKDPAIKQATVTCFYKGEQRSNMNKICYYDCLGSAYAITVGAVELCPLSIQQ
jgi:hypothetical protein